MNSAHILRIANSLPPKKRIASHTQYPTFGPSNAIIVIPSWGEIQGGARSTNGEMRAICPNQLVKPASFNYVLSIQRRNGP